MGCGARWTGYICANCQQSKKFKFVAKCCLPLKDAITKKKTEKNTSFRAKRSDLNIWNFVHPNFVLFWSYQQQQPFEIFKLYHRNISHVVDEIGMDDAIYSTSILSTFCLFALKAWNIKWSKNATTTFWHFRKPALYVFSEKCMIRPFQKDEHCLFQTSWF